MSWSEISNENRAWVATLVASARITAPKSPEDVRRLRFLVDPGFDGRIGQCLLVRAPGQFGQRFHERLYSIADLEQTGDNKVAFELLVRRCHVIDDFNGERYDGVASNYLCDMPLGGQMSFSGPVGHPFPIPEDREAGLLMIGMGTGIAPFRGLVRRIYDELGGWKGPVRLFHGARSGLEMLYQNDENADLGLYYDQPTFKAFAAVSPRPHFDEPPALDQALLENAGEVWEMLQDDRTHVFIAGPESLTPMLEKALAKVVGSPETWKARRAKLQAGGRWHDVLY
ncbi:oxidoreductase [Rhodoblastus sphagnicola]|uniref:Oxidoreductase n=1 Tax=Rhodoblastus sphagnicola TaxID=333368 RepID=A0A2S6ND51_9HYPH|nr:FAD-binding oxidoreductase [Rhodoblastus sphagnicola]MBB4198027.1 ferredoxin--NADP+ reductase [Rhodoblastus sphagnicola]PPQ32542.1 oxidoreductase [Rhodoblastus sphagnicola]